MRVRTPLTLLLGLLCFAIAGHAAVRAETTLDRLKRKGVVRIGITNEYPVSFRKPDDTFDGREYEVAAKAFATLGVSRMEPVVLDWAGLIPALKAHRIDAVVASLLIKPERCRQVAFTNPDTQDTNLLVVHKGNPKNLHSFDDVIKNPAVTVAAIQGGASALTVKRLGIPAAQTQLLPGYVELQAAMQSGRVDAVASDTIASTQFIAGNPAALERAEPFAVPVIGGKPDRNFGAFAFRPEDKELLDGFNTFLAGFVGSDAHVVILKKFGISPDAVPIKGITAADICKE